MANLGTTIDPQESQDVAETSQEVGSEQRSQSATREELSDALSEELGHTHRTVKTAMRWTGASESCVKLWLAGTHAPRGVHLVELMRRSDEVLRSILLAAGRQDAVIAFRNPENQYPSANADDG